MKKTFRILILAAALVCTLCVSASADYVGSDVFGMARSYEELVTALADPNVTDLTIYPRWETEYESGNYEYFTWPEGDVTLDLQPANTSCRIWLGNGDWTIPENVTVNAYKGVRIGSPTGTGVIIDGTWNVMNNGGSLGNVSGGDGNGNIIHYGSVTVNGTLTIAKDLRVTPVTCDTFILNGKIENAGTLYLNNLVMGDGAEIVEIKNPDLVNSTRTVNLQGTLSCPVGTAIIGGELAPTNGTTTGADTYMTGNFEVDQLQMGSSTSLTITEGSYVKVGRLVSNRDDWTPVLNVNGTLELVGAEYSHSYDGNATMNLGDKGVLKVNAGETLDYDDSTAVINGTGTIELYAIMWEYDWGDGQTRIDWGDKARLLGCDDETPTQVAETVTIWRSWENDTCAHQWGQATVLEATCGAEGYTYCFCDLCGVEKHSNEVRRTNKHTVTFTPRNERYVYLDCSVCGGSAPIYIEAENANWTGQPVQTATLNGATDWLETLPEIVYTNNVDLGTATASATFGTITISTTFEIVGCVHEGGTATCSAQAVCTKCGEPYGELASHTEKTPATCKSKAVCAVCGQEYGEVLSYHRYTIASDAQTHWVECSGCGVGFLEEEYGYTSKDQVDLEVWAKLFMEAFEMQSEMQGTSNKDAELWLMRMLELGDYSAVTQHSYEDGKCVVCGHGSKPATAVTGTISGVKSDAAIKIMQAGQLVGEAAAEDGSFSVSASGECDVVITKGGCLTYTVKGVNVSDANIDLGEIQLVAGDVNEDDKINIADMGVFRQEFGKTGDAIGNACTDVNGDGKVNIADMGVFRQNFGKTAEKDCTVEYGA